MLGSHELREVHNPCPGVAYFTSVVPTTLDRFPVAEKSSLDAAPAANARFTRPWYRQLTTRAATTAE
jgi:hypothetical protein